MGMVRVIGKNYYGIETEKDKVSGEIQRKVREAFEEASRVPSEKLDIRLASPEGPTLVPDTSQRTDENL